MKKMNKKGFTLVEIMIVVAIIGLLAAIGIPSFQKARANTMKKNAINNARLVIAAVDQYNMETGQAGVNEVDQAAYVAYLKNGLTGIKVGAISAANVSADGTETAEELAAELYADIF